MLFSHLDYKRGWGLFIILCMYWETHSLNTEQTCPLFCGEGGCISSIANPKISVCTMYIYDVSSYVHCTMYSVQYENLYVDRTSKKGAFLYRHTIFCLLILADCG
jgi:hypothetical protein